MTKLKMCQDCNTEFLPSSRHKSCPSCRHRKNKTPCESCGVPCGKRYDKCRSCSSKDSAALGSEHPNWKGGVLTTKAGYVRVHSPEHPRVYGKKSKYVFEHILVMEKSIGRYLKEGENVHHRNGVKSDNRIENLELWSTPQPSGIRVSDAVQWANEILRLHSAGLLKEI